MTTGWLLLLLTLVSSQRVDSQSTTGDEVCDTEPLDNIRRDIQRLQDNQQQLLQTIMNRLGKL